MCIVEQLCYFEHPSASEIRSDDPDPSHSNNTVLLYEKFYTLRRLAVHFIKQLPLIYIVVKAYLYNCLNYHRYHMLVNSTQ